MASPGTSASISPDINKIEAGLGLLQPGDVLDNSKEQAGRQQNENPAHNDGIHVQGANDAQPVNAAPSDGASDPERRMIGDFEGSANALWTLFGKQAKSHDEATIQTLKKDMDGLLIFAGLFSTALTAFIIESKKDLKVDPQDQLAYYLQLNAAVLYNISRQISSIAPQFPIPSDPPPAYSASAFKPSGSNIRVNAFWFMALVFSLSAALLATLVQQWVRDYMRVFQQYSGPLKSARLRQYLHEGWKGWYMPVVAEAVTALLHVSLFLFFAGLFDFVLKIDTAVKLSTTIPIAITSFLYICTIVARMFKPQSPYKNPVTGLMWYIIQKFGGRRYKDRDSTEKPKSVSPDMAEGQMQLAMKRTEGREGRDERSIRWLVSNTTEDAEMESLVMAIPGSFDGEWGTKVWKKVSNTTEDNLHQNEPSCMQRIFPPFLRRVRSHTTSNSHVNSAGHMEGEDTVGELGARVGDLLDTCKSSGLFTTKELWRVRTRACIETIASLVCCAGAKLGQFGDIVKLLGDIGKDQTVRESSLVGKDQSFVMRWTCLSLMAIRPILESNRSLQDDARLASQHLEREGEQTRTDKIIETLDKASECLKALSDDLAWWGIRTEEQGRVYFRRHKPQISSLEKIVIDIEDDEFLIDDWSIGSVRNLIDQITHEVIIRQLPGVKYDLYDAKTVNFSHFVELFRDAPTLPFIFPLQNLKRIRTFSQTLRRILEGQESADTIAKTIKDLEEFRSLPNWSDKPVRRQVWRLQDLSGGGGLGFTVELFFLALKQLLSTSASKESHSAFYIGTFRSITSEWSEHKDSPGTQKLLLDMVTPEGGLIFGFDYPTYIIDKFLAFLGKILEEQTGQHIDDVVRKLTNVPNNSPHHALSVKVLAVIRAQA